MTPCVTPRASWRRKVRLLFLAALVALPSTIAGSKCLPGHLTSAIVASRPNRLVAFDPDKDEFVRFAESTALRATARRSLETLDNGEMLVTSGGNCVLRASLANVDALQPVLDEAFCSPLSAAEFSTIRQAPDGFLWATDGVYVSTWINGRRQERFDVGGSDSLEVVDVAFPPFAVIEGATLAPTAAETLSDEATLSLTVESASNVRTSLDFWTLPDLFVDASLPQGVRCQTPIVPNSASPTWNEVCDTGTYLVRKGSSVSFTLYDRDDFDSDTVCTGAFNLDQVDAVSYRSGYTVYPKADSGVCFRARAFCKKIGYADTDVYFSYCLVPQATPSPTRPSPAGGVTALMLGKTGDRWGVTSLKVENGGSGMGEVEVVVPLSSSNALDAMPTSIETLGSDGDFVIAKRTAGIWRYEADGATPSLKVTQDDGFDAGVVRVSPNGKLLLVGDLSGSHRIAVFNANDLTLPGCELGRSLGDLSVPMAITFAAGVFAPSSRLAISPSLQQQVAQVGEPLVFEWDAFDASGDLLDSTRASVEDFEVTVAGKHHFSARSYEVFEFAVKLSIVYSADRRKWTATYRPTLASLAFPRSADWNVSNATSFVLDDHIDHVDVRAGNALFEYAFELSVKAGRFHSKAHISGSPRSFFVRPGPPSGATSIVVRSPPILVSGEEGTILVTLYDSALNKLWEGGAAARLVLATVSVEQTTANATQKGVVRTKSVQGMTVTDLGDGSYLIRFRLEAAGRKNLGVLLDGSVVRGGGNPFDVEVVAAGVAPSKSQLSGRTFALLTGDESSFSLIPRDAFGNVLEGSSATSMNVTAVIVANIGRGTRRLASTVTEVSGRYVVRWSVPRRAHGNITVTVYLQGSKVETYQVKLAARNRRVEFESDQALRLACLILGGLQAFFVLLAAVLVVRYSQTSVIRAAQRPFLLLLLLGLGLTMGNVIVGYWPRTALTCTVETWLLHTGFALSCGSLFAKTHVCAHSNESKYLTPNRDNLTTRRWRVAKLANNTKLKRMRIKNRPLLLIVFLITGATVAYLGLAMYFSGGLVPVDEVSNVALFDEDSGATVEEFFPACARSDADGIYIGLYAYEVALLGWGVYLSIKVRKVNTAFSESTYIVSAVAIYETAAVTVLTALIYEILGRQDPDFTLVLQLCIVTLTAGATLFLIFIPKFWSIWSGKEIRMRDFFASTEMSSSGEFSGTNQHAGHSTLRKSAAGTSLSGRTGSSKCSIKLGTSRSSDAGHSKGIELTNQQSLPEAPNDE